MTVPSFPVGSGGLLRCALNFVSRLNKKTCSLWLHGLSHAELKPAGCIVIINIGISPFYATIIDAYLANPLYSMACLGSVHHPT